MDVQLTQNTYDYYLKLLIIGETGVGKTSLLLSFTGENLQNKGATIGVDFKHKMLTIDGKITKLQIWDTAGQERFRTLTKSYFKLAQGIILVFDLTDENSIDNLKTWIDQIKENTSENTVNILVGNKSDKDERKVSSELAKSFAEKNNMKYFETSSRNKESVNEMFDVLCRDIISKGIDDSRYVRLNKTNSIRSGNSSVKDSYCCIK